MVLHLLRVLFIVMCGVVVGVYAVNLTTPKLDARGHEILPQWTYTHAVIAVLSTMLMSGVLVLADLATPRKKLSALSGVFVGLLAGMVAAWALAFIVDYVRSVYPFDEEIGSGIKLLIGIVCVYLAITFVMQTKDDFRFIIPYIEFSKQIRGTRPMLLDTSAIIDGRILDIGKTHALQGLLVVPRFVLHELQTVADSSDKIKRVRGRRGLDILAKLQGDPNMEVAIEDADAEGVTVDQQLVSMAQDLHARLVTTDFNLAKIAGLRGVDVINVNELAEALRPVVLPGELLSVKVVKPGESAGQGVGFLDDGTMVVVESARDLIGQDVALTVTSSLQTSAGRMIFGKLSTPRSPGRGDPRST